MNQVIWTILSYGVVGNSEQGKKWDKIGNLEIERWSLKNKWEFSFMNQGKYTNKQETDPCKMQKIKYNSNLQCWKIGLIVGLIEEFISIN